MFNDFPSKATCIQAVLSHFIDPSGGINMILESTGFIWIVQTVIDQKKAIRTLTSYNVWERGHQLSQASNI